MTSEPALQPATDWSSATALDQASSCIQHQNSSRASASRHMPRVLIPPDRQEAHLGVGDAVGVRVGSGVTAGVGVSVGAGVGVEVGARDGVDVGAGLGVEVGAIVGVSVGAKDLGVPVGAGAGMEVGAPEGVGIGTGLGRKVGAVVGVSVGEGVGLDVGAWEGVEVGAGVGLHAQKACSVLPVTCSHHAASCSPDGRQSRRDCAPVSAQFQHAPGVGVNSSVLSVSCVGRP